MKKLFILLVYNVLIINLFASENYFQTIRGKVYDINTEFALIGATVIIIDSNPIIGTITDLDGNFKLENVPIGRQSLQVSYVGYKPSLIRDVILHSGKELVLEIALEENVIEGEEVVIKANGKKDRPINELALISARSFTVEETERFAGNWFDPARMASSFAGVMSAADQENDIIIRGNSPTGMLWRLEGVNIPNPNHFGGLGSTGGPISMLNTNVLSNSDFLTGAFPAEYGNALAGVFDLKLRKGNYEKHEFTAQVGMNGFELAAEGPVIRTITPGKNPTFLVDYRYSTLSVFDALGINMGIGAIPFYQDVTFKIDVPGTKLGSFTLFGMGGENHIEFDGNDTIKPIKEISQSLYGVDDTIIARQDYTYFSSLVGILGFSHVYYFNENNSIKNILSASYQGNGSESRGLKFSELNYDYGDKMWEAKYSLNTQFRKRINSKNHIESGVIIDYYNFSYIDSSWVKKFKKYISTIHSSGNLLLVQAYSSWKHNFSENLTCVTGLHYQKTTLNNNFVFEPRFGLDWKFRPKQSFNLGYGMHSQIQPRVIYFTETLIDTLNQIYEQTNEALDFTQSHHYIIGYNYLFKENHRLKIEAYYQKLYNVPVKQYPSYLSMVNYGSGAFFLGTYDSLVNSGTGKNYGIEFTLEKFLSNNYYYMITLSLFDSKYSGSDGIKRNTLFNGNYVVNALGGYEFKFNNQNSLAINAKGVIAGGLRNIPVKIEESIEKGRAIYDYDRAFEERNEMYYRVDLSISYVINRPKSTHTITFDGRNITNHINPFIQDFDIETGKVEKISQLGIVPAGLYRINF